jgi:hypothetical protein
LLQQESQVTPRELLLLLLYFHSGKKGICLCVCVCVFFLFFFLAKISHGVGDRKTKFKRRPVKCTKGFFWVKEYAKVAIFWGNKKLQVDIFRQ